MLTDQPTPSDTVELLLRDIAVQLRRLVAAPWTRCRATALAFAAIVVSGCVPDTPSVPGGVLARRLPPTASAPRVPSCATDNDCGGDTPRCDLALGRCVACDGSYGSGGPHACGPLLPACAINGRCVECVDADGCADIQFACQSNSCGACNTDGDCATGRCHADGHCAPLSAVAYVDHDQPCRDDPHLSSPTDPYCEIQAALPDSGEVVVHLAASTTPYAQVELDAVRPLDVTILGPGADQATIASPDEHAVMLRAIYGQPGKLTMLDLSLRGGTLGAGLRCTGEPDKAEIRLSRITIAGSENNGIDAYGCDLSIDHAVVRESSDGIALDSCTYSLSDVVAANNRRNGIDLDNSEGTAIRLTITDNAYVGIRCSAANEIKDSILGGNNLASPTGLPTDQADSRCVLLNPTFLPG